MTNLRSWVLILLLAATLGIIEKRGDTDRVPPSKPLADLPSSLDGWHSRDVVITPDVLEVLGNGAFLNRVYRPGPDAAVPDAAVPGAAGPGAAVPGANVPKPVMERPPVALFIAYFPTQRSGQSIHSPQNCLPGAGWSFEQSGVTEWTDASGHFTVGDYLISNGSERQEVLYWYRSHGRNIANDYAAKYYMLRDSVLYSRTDAALIRISTPIPAGEKQQDAHTRVLGFARLVTPVLSQYVPD